MKRPFVHSGVLIAVVTLVFLYAISPLTSLGSGERVFRVERGEGIKDIARRLEKEGFIRSRYAFTMLSVLTGSTLRLKAGVYEFGAADGSFHIMNALVRGASDEVEVRIRDGSSLYEVDDALSEAGVLAERAFLVFVASSTGNLEGTFFPDTYRFLKNSTPADVAKKFKENFDKQAAPILAEDPENYERNLILASLLEKEVPDFEDRRMVAGVLLKREETGLPLQVDATVCYVKQMVKAGAVSCYPITQSDMMTPSPYNTYRHKGLPPGPIGSPSVSALRAALSPLASPYWFYLSDPITQKTVFSKTLDEHLENRNKFLR